MVQFVSVIVFSKEGVYQLLELLTMFMKKSKFLLMQRFNFRNFVKNDFLNTSLISFREENT